MKWLRRILTVFYSAAVILGIQDLRVCPWGAGERGLGGDADWKGSGGTHPKGAGAAFCAFFEDLTKKSQVKFSREWAKKTSAQI